MERTITLQAYPMFYKNSVGLYSREREKWKQGTDQGPWGLLPLSPICSHSTHDTCQNRGSLQMVTPKDQESSILPQASTYCDQNIFKTSAIGLIQEGQTQHMFIGHIPNKPQTYSSGSNFQLLTRFALALRVGMENPERLRLHPVWVEKMPRAAEARPAKQGCKY